MATLQATVKFSDISIDSQLHVHPCSVTRAMRTLHAHNCKCYQHNVSPHSTTSLTIIINAAKSVKEMIQGLQQSRFKPRYIKWQYKDEILPHTSMTYTTLLWELSNSLTFPWYSRQVITLELLRNKKWNPEKKNEKGFADWEVHAASCQWVL